MLLAELEVRHTRPISPTRRVALGELFLPTDPAPGFGGVLLGAITAAFAQHLDDDLSGEFLVLLSDMESGRLYGQPRLRHRYQRDVVGLDRSRHRLYGDGEELRVDLEDKGHPLPQVLAAAYAANMLTMRARPIVFRLLRRATLWAGPPGPALISFLTGDSAASSWTRVAVDARWARRALGFDEHDRPDKADVVRRYRDLVRLAHPDTGGLPDAAGERIARLSEARRILLAV